MSEIVTTPDSWGPGGLNADVLPLIGGTEHPSQVSPERWITALQDALAHEMSAREAAEGTLTRVQESESRLRKQAEVAAQEGISRRRDDKVARNRTAVLTAALNAVSDEPDLDRLLGQLLVAVTDQFGTASSSLWLHHEEAHGMSLHLECVRGKRRIRKPPGTGGDRATFLPDAHPHLVTVISNREPAVLPIDQVLGRYSARYLKKGIQTALVVPLLTPSAPMGMVAFHGYAPDALGSNEMAIARAVAAQMTVSLKMEQLARAAQHMAIIEERNRLAREIHDTLAQGFVAILWQLQVIETEATAALKGSGAAQHIETAKRLARDNIAQARRSVQALRPPIFDRADLPQALRTTVERLRGEQPVPLNFQLTGTPWKTPQAVEEEMLRIAQEALNNALHHAHARRIDVELDYHPEREARVTIRDDGVGFDPAKKKLQHYGLTGMAERARRIGADLWVNTVAGHGTEITVIWTPRHSFVPTVPQ